MKRTWLAVVSCVVGLQLTQTGSIAPVAFANGGGIGAAGGGTGVTTPPPPLSQMVTPGALTIPIEGRVPGAANGTLRLVFKLFEGDVELFTETRAVAIDDERFSMRLGAGDLAGLPVSVLAGTKSAVVRWARETTPTVQEGSQYLAAAPYAMTLSPGARIKSSGIAPALTVSNTSTGIKATASGTTGRAVVGESTSGAGNSFGVEGRAVSSSGAAGHFINTTGDLIVGRAAVNGEVKFRVANNGDVFVRGVKIGQQGPKGDKGAPGTPGRDGDRGPEGQRGATGPGTANTFCIAGAGSTCLSLCGNGSALVASMASPCQASNGCEWAGDDGVCCVCTATH